VVTTTRYVFYSTSELDAIYRQRDDVDLDNDVILRLRDNIVASSTYQLRK